MRTHRIFLLLALAGPLPEAAVSAWQADPAGEERLLHIQQRIQAGDLRAARIELRDALQASPGDPRLYNFRGVVEAQEDHFAAAESDFQRAIRTAPRFTGAYLNLGRLYQEHPDQPRAREKAVAVYEQLLGMEADHVEANYQAALLWNQLGSYAASLRHLKRLPAGDRWRPPALALRCANQAALGRTAQAEADAALLMASGDLSEADILLAVPALVAHHAGDLAARLLEGAARRGLASGAGLRQLSAIREEQGRFPEARAALERCLEREPPSAGVLFSLARLSYRAGEMERALGYLGHARDLEPANAAVHFFFGMVCVELKLPPEATKSLQEAVRLDPDNAYYHYALGAVLLNAKHADEAIPHFRRYRAARPEDPRGRFALGVACFEASQEEAARREFLAVAARPETRLGAHLYLGRLALRRDNLEEAQSHLQQAIQANSSAPEPYAELALVLIRQKKYSVALENLTCALKLAPDHYRSNLHLLMLYQRTKDPRAEAQAKRVAELQNAGEEKERLLLRSLELRPY